MSILDRRRAQVRGANDAAFTSAVNRLRRASGSIAGNGASGSAMPSMSSNSSTSSGSASGIPSRTRSRAVCSSRPSTPVAARSRRATAWKGTWLVCDSQNAVNTSISPASAIAETSRTRRLLPMPGEPTTPTTAPCPSTARSNSPSTADISHRRPTNFDSARPTARCWSLHAQQAMGRDRLIGTLDLNQLRLAESRCAFNQPCGGRAEHHPAGRSDRLHPLSHTDLLADGGVTERRRNRFHRRSPGPS